MRRRRRTLQQPRHKSPSGICCPIRDSRGDFGAGRVDGVHWSSRQRLTPDQFLRELQPSETTVID